MYCSNILAAMRVATLTNSAAAAPIEARDMTAAQVVSNFQIVITLSENLQQPAQSITLWDFLTAPLSIGNVYVN
jgi:hypothetical protein